MITKVTDTNTVCY